MHITFRAILLIRPLYLKVSRYLYNNKAYFSQMSSDFEWLRLKPRHSFNTQRSKSYTDYQSTISKTVQKNSYSRKKAMKVQ